MLKSPSAGSLTVALMRVIWFFELIGGVDAVLAEHRDRHHVDLLRRDDVAVAALFDLLPSPQRHGIGARHPRRLEEARRVEPEVELIQLRQLRRHRHRRAIAVDMPGDAAVDDVRLAQCLLRGRAVLPAEAVLPRRGIQAGLPIERLDARARLPVDGAGVVGERVDAGPVDVDGVLVGLADRGAVAGAREGDAREGRLRRSPRGRVQDRRGVHVAGREALRRDLDGGEWASKAANGRMRFMQGSVVTECSGAAGSGPPPPSGRPVR